MNRILRTSATALIVAVGLAAGHTSAEMRPQTTEISQATCEARFVRSKKPIRKFHVAGISEKVYEEQVLVVDDWPEHALDILGALNNSNLDDGELSIVDCAGSRSNVRVRTRYFDLEHVNRQGSEGRGWRFNAEAEDLDQPIIRVVRLELPPSHEWQLNDKGDGLIATQVIFHPFSEENSHWFNRIRVTEVKYENNALFVTQRTTTDNQFDSLQNWALK